MASEPLISQFAIVPSVLDFHRATRTKSNLTYFNCKMDHCRLLELSTSAYRADNKADVYSNQSLEVKHTSTGVVVVLLPRN